MRRATIRDARSFARTMLRTLNSIFVVFVVTLVAAPALAKRTPGEQRFPPSVSDEVVRELLQVGRVEPRGAHDANGWKRWGQAASDKQEAAMRAVIDALQGTRPPLSVAASILAIARVESGWNPYSENPNSTACGLFQFVKATWQVYSGTRETCFDPSVNAWAGVKHLTALYADHVRPALVPIEPVTSEQERLAWTYRLLYAYHYHGEGAPEASGGGSLVAQSAAEAGIPQLFGFFSILRKATTVVKPNVRAASRKPVRARARRRQA